MRSRYIVTVNPPVYVSVEADNEEQAKGIAADYWDEQNVAGRLTYALEETSWYVGGDVDLFDSVDTDVSEDLS